MNEYKELRKKVGTQVVVSELLGLSVTALSNRETGKVTIIDEYMLALKQLLHTKLFG